MKSIRDQETDWVETNKNEREEIQTWNRNGTRGWRCNCKRQQKKHSKTYNKTHLSFGQRDSELFCFFGYEINLLKFLLQCRVVSCPSCVYKETTTECYIVSIQLILPFKSQSICNIPMEMFKKWFAIPCEWYQNTEKSHVVIARSINKIFGPRKLTHCLSYEIGFTNRLSGHGWSISRVHSGCYIREATNIRTHVMRFMWNWGMTCTNHDVMSALTFFFQFFGHHSKRELTW